MRPFLLALAALLAAVIGVNGLATWIRAADNARLRTASGAFAPGQVLIGYRYVDERVFQRQRLAAIPAPRVVAFGSSRAMQMDGALLGLPPGAFYNTALSSGTVEDFIGLWTTLKDLGKVPEVAYFSIDGWVFNERFPQVGWLAYADEVARFLAGGSGPGARVMAQLSVVQYRWYHAKELLSYAVLRQSAQDLRAVLRGQRRSHHDEPEAVVPEAAAAGLRALRADGSLIYERAVQQRTPAEVREHAGYYLRDNVHLADFRWDATRAARLEALWRDMRAQGVRVVAYMPPYHPLVWRALGGSAVTAGPLAQARQSLRRQAARVGARFEDFSDPASVPCAETEFFDGVHPRPGCLGRLLERLRSGR
jgi:hypothetical protein